MSQKLIVGIAGGSGSGKSWLAERIGERFPGQTTLISHDWYYRDLSGLPREAASRTNFDHPDALETDLLIEHIDKLVEGRTINAPNYDFAQFKRASESRELIPKSLIVVEGLFALENASLRKRYTDSIFIDAPSDLRLIRRIRRDLKERGYELEQILRSWEQHAMPTFESIVLPTARFASERWKSLINKTFVEDFLTDLSRRLQVHGDDENRGFG